jgi:hypothetical protein
MDIKRGIKAIQISQSVLRGGNEAVNRRPDTAAERYLLSDIRLISLKIHSRMVACSFYEKKGA